MSVVRAHSHRRLTYTILVSAIVVIGLAFTIGCSARASVLRTRASNWARAYATYWCARRHWPATPQQVYEAVNPTMRDSLGGPMDVKQDRQSADLMTVLVTSEGMPSLTKSYDVKTGEGQCESLRLAGDF